MMRCCCGGRWRLSGTKRFITFGCGDVLVTLFRGTFLDTPQSPFRGAPLRADQDAALLVRDGRIVRDLGLRIVSGELGPGDRLPAEATLCEAYDVSRPVLREATRVLVAKGLVVSRQRAGAIVRPRNEWHLLEIGRAHV